MDTLWMALERVRQRLKRNAAPPESLAQPRRQIAEILTFAMVSHARPMVFAQILVMVCRRLGIPASVVRVSKLLNETEVVRNAQKTIVLVARVAEVAHARTCPHKAVLRAPMRVLAMMAMNWWKRLLVSQLAEEGSVELFLRTP
jgi:hypothetical protein